MIRKLLRVLIVFIPFGTVAQDSGFSIYEFFPIEKSHSYIEFSTKYMGFAKVKGRFEGFNGTFRFNGNDLSNTSISLSINVNSIDTDHDMRDKDLKSENWFDTEKFPIITFVSTKIQYIASGFNIIGNLTIKDITKEVVVKMNPPSGILKDIRGDSQVILTGETIIDRTDFGVAGKRWSAVKEGITAVAKEIEIEVSILGKQKNLSNLKNLVKNYTRPSGKIYTIISSKGVIAGIELFEKMLIDPENKLRSNTLNNVGNVLLKEGRLEESLKVFEKNLEFFPQESYLYDSYAQALVLSGDLTKAKIYYQRALEKNSNNNNAKEILRHLK